MIGSSAGIIDPDGFWKALRKAWRNEELPINSLKRTVTLESWLRHLTNQGVLKNSFDTKRQKHRSSVGAQELQELAQPKSSAS